MNSRGERRPSESDSGSTRRVRGEQPAARKRRDSWASAGGAPSRETVARRHLGGASGIRTVGIDLANRCRRGLLDHRDAWPHAPGSRTCLSAIPAPRWPSRVARLQPHPNGEQDMEFRLSAASTHIPSGHAVPPSSGRGRRAGASPMKSKEKGVAGSYQRASASSGPFIPYFLRQPSATLRGYR